METNFSMLRRRYPFCVLKIKALVVRGFFFFHGSGPSQFGCAGPMRVDGNMTDAPNYFPNSFSGPAPADKSYTAWNADKVSGEVARYPTGDEDNFSQAR